MYQMYQSHIHMECKLEAVGTLFFSIHLPKEYEYVSKGGCDDTRRRWGHILCLGLQNEYFATKSLRFSPFIIRLLHIKAVTFRS